MDKKTLVKEHAANHRYFSLEEVVKVAGITRPLAKKYLHELKEAGVVFSAGRGIYSNISKTFPLTEEKSRVAEIRQMLTREYPELDFIIWNTLTFQPYYHHQQTHNITFVEVEFDAIHTVFDRISRDYRFVLMEKTSRVAPKGFDITRDPIVVRLLNKESPREGHAAALEKMLVDLFIIKDKYSTMGNADYWELLESVDDFYRVNVSDFVRYAKARRYFRDIYSQLVDKEGLDKVTFATYLKYVDKVTSKKDGHGKADR